MSLRMHRAARRMFKLPTPPIGCTHGWIQCCREVCRTSPRCQVVPCIHHTCDAGVCCGCVGVLLAEPGAAASARSGRSIAVLRGHFASLLIVSLCRFFTPLPVPLSLQALCAAASSFSSFCP